MMKALFIIFVFFSFSKNLHAFQTARQLSFAGSGALNPYGVDALNLNPATLNLRADIIFGGGYSFGDVSSEQDVTSYYGWLKDSSSSAFGTKENKKMQKSLEGLSGFPVAAAFLFNSLKVEDSSQEILEYKSYNVGLSKLLGKRASFGLTLSYFDGVNGPSFKESFLTADVGALYWISRNLKVGVSALDLLNTADGVLTEELNPQKARLSLAYSANIIDLYADLERTFSGEFEGDTDMGLGLETFFKEFLSVRFGVFKRESLNDLDFGAGLSFTGPKLEIHYGFRSNSSTDTFLNSIDFSVPLW